MSTIAYFVSDFGFGHATRSIAIIQALLECNLEITINILTSNPLNLMKRSLDVFQKSQQVDFHEQQNDVGFIATENTGKIDHQRTALAVQQWMTESFSACLFEGYRYLQNKKIDLIISDITPQAFLIAKKLDIPSIAISNFTWFDIYQNLPIKLEVLETIWKAYREASLGLMLPFNLNNVIFPTLLETDLVSRKTTRNKDDMLELLQIDSSSVVIYAGTGMSQDNPFMKKWATDTDMTFILGSRSKVTGHNIRNIPPDDSEAQDFIASSDIVVLKLGYSSVSEAIRSQVPIIGVDFAQTAETIFMSKKLQELNIGICITPEDYFSGKWLEYIPTALKMKKNYSSLPARFIRKGEIQITNIITELLEEIA